ncbi:regulatory protein, luxR family [Vibrio xiamenensis]|uniref:Regulatory protein, luxR family n=1 Tax=Vibrio xiamenensis TaxID=861298 RepID=A0A1G8AEU1_9VIBR|nr:LuxR C-terminal-related transcriptional regulator [Vibrio xiamenensis]SDH19458.1 regulatory protein, luxR family [Vibrio xiamenensis]
MTEKSFSSIILLSNCTMQVKALSDSLKNVLDLPIAITHPLQLLESPSAMRRSLLIIDLDVLNYETKQALLTFLATQSVFTVLINAPDKMNFHDIVKWKGIRGIFGKATDIEKLQQGLLAISSGENWLPRGILSKMLEHYEHSNAPKPIVKKPVEGPVNLTKREKQILQMMSTNQSNSQLADTLYISEHTVKTHLNNIFKKIQVRNKNEALEWIKDNLH